MPGPMALMVMTISRTWAKPISRYMPITWARAVKDRLRSARAVYWCVEEIFGGSPWVIFSHVLSGFAKGTDLSVQSQVIPEMVYYGIDTVYLKHVVADTNEPHYFDANFDPYHISYGYGETTITTYVGAKDPCSLVEPAISMPAILDPGFDNHTVTLIPNADAGNPDLAGYPKQVTGTFLEVRVEVNNSTAR